MGLGMVLLAAVAFCPWLDADTLPAGWTRLHALFAHDVVVQRTAVASALGLAVTAWVFFRPGAAGKHFARSGRDASPDDVVGA
jgi:hypothetical protein